MKVTLNWKTEFDTQEELDEFIHKISRIHSERYGCIDIVNHDLHTHGNYIGAVNRIYLLVTKE